MPVAMSDIKYYKSDAQGNIDLNSQIIDDTVIFDDVLDIANDVEKKIFVKNCHATDSLTLAKFYNVAGFTINNTNNTPIITTGNKLYSNISPGVYAATFPTVNSIIITPPSGISRVPISVTCDGSTLQTVYLLDNLPIFLKFSPGLTTADQATITISDGASFIYVAAYSGSVPGTYALRNNYNTGLDIGTLAAGQAYPLSLKQSIPDGTSNAGNPRKVRLITRGQAA